MGTVSSLRRRLSDSELVVTEFRVSDPERLEGLSTGVPDPEAHPIIIGFYDETPAGGRLKNPNFPFIRCCHCGLRRHWKGHVVRDDQGKLYIIGASGCGREHYGARYEEAERLFRSEQARRRALLRWHNMLKLALPLADEVEALLQSTGLAAIELKRSEIERASPTGFSRLQHHCGPGNPLVETRVERDYAAEKDREDRYQRALATYQSKPPEVRRRLRDEGLKPEEDGSPIYKRDYIPLGNIVGGGFLTAEGDARAAALALRETLKAIRLIEERGTENAQLTELQRLLNQMTERPRILYKALHSLSFTSLFFEQQNLERLARWSHGDARCSYFIDGSSLVIDDRSRGRTSIEPITFEEANVVPASESILYIEYYDDEFLPMKAQAA